MNNIIDAAGGLKDGSGINFDGVAIVTKFYEAIQDAFTAAEGDPGTLPKFNAMPIVNSIIDAILVGDFAIKEAVKTMVQSGIDLLGKASGAENYDFSGILGGMDVTDLLGFLSDGTMEQLMNEATGGISTYTQKTEEALNKGQKQLEQKYGQNNDGVGIKVSGLILDENFMTNLEAQMTALQAELDNNDSYTLELRPVFKTDGIGDEVSSLSEFINGTIPIKFDTASINLSETPLLIDDSSIISKMESLRAELSMTRATIKSAVDSAGMQVASRIAGLSSSFRGMSVRINGKALVGAITEEMGNALGEEVGEINVD